METIQPSSFSHATLRALFIFQLQSMSPINPSWQPNHSEQIRLISPWFLGFAQVKEVALLVNILDSNCLPEYHIDTHTDVWDLFIYFGCFNWVYPLFTNNNILDFRWQALCRAGLFISLLITPTPTPLTLLPPPYIQLRGATQGL